MINFLIENSVFIPETNGISLGSDMKYVEKIESSCSHLQKQELLNKAIYMKSDIYEGA